MKHDIEAVKAFCRHTETGEIIVIEKRRDGALVGGCSASEPLKDLDSYECNPDTNLRISENSETLELM